MRAHVLATKQSDGEVEEVEEEVEEEQWFTGPAMLRATAAEKYVAKWQTRRKAAANWALWDFEVPFQPFDDASLNEPLLPSFRSGLFRAGDFDWRLLFGVAWGTGDDRQAAFTVTLQNAHAAEAPPHWQCDAVYRVQIAGLKTESAFGPTQKTFSATRRHTFSPPRAGTAGEPEPVAVCLASLPSACSERRYGAFAGGFFTVRLCLKAGRTLDSDNLLDSAASLPHCEHPIRKRDRQYHEALREIKRLKQL
ncbi:hypothetical protein DIPPA_14602 [Diplonema papillatum]|nr:hypothetical protein DIPPA_14602 [Diplonema papillatum]